MTIKATNIKTWVVCGGVQTKSGALRYERKARNSKHSSFKSSFPTEVKGSAINKLRPPPPRSFVIGFVMREIALYNMLLFKKCPNDTTLCIMSRNDTVFATIFVLLQFNSYGAAFSRVHALATWGQCATDVRSKSRNISCTLQRIKNICL